MKLNNKGFTLVEMLIVALIFIVVIVITGNVFETILAQTSKLYKSEESNIEGVVGLEMFRHDLVQANFGLPYSFNATTPITYREAGYLPASAYNDAPSGIPRAFVAGNNLGAVADPNSYSGVTFSILPGSDYIAIKATSVGSNETSQKWTYLTYSSVSKPAKTWPSGNFKSGDKLIMISRSFSQAGYINQLAYDTATPSTYWAGFATGGYATGFTPKTPTEVLYLYGINSGSDVGMPFNRVDYFIGKPSDTSRIPSSCAPNTGILYRASVNHNSTTGGNLTYMPILDCVADMQVIFGWNLADNGDTVLIDTANTTANNNILGSGKIDTWSNANGSLVSSSVGATTAQVQAAMADSGHVRTKLKIVKVYVLAQNGRKDTNYVSPTPIFIGDPGEASLTVPAGYAITSTMQNYRWKVYRIIIKPKNLTSNQ